MQSGRPLLKQQEWLIGSALNLVNDNDDNVSDPSWFIHDIFDHENLLNENSLPSGEHICECPDCQQLRTRIKALEFITKFIGENTGLKRVMVEARATTHNINRIGNQILNFWGRKLYIDMLLVYIASQSAMHPLVWKCATPNASEAKCGA